MFEMSRAEPLSEDEAFERLQERYGAFKMRPVSLGPPLTPRDVFLRPSFVIPMGLYLTVMAFTLWHGLFG